MGKVNLRPELFCLGKIRKLWSVVHSNCLEYLAEAREVTGLKVVTEVTEVEAVDAVAHYADILQIGARNMQNFRLLKEVGRCNKPVMRYY